MPVTVNGLRTTPYIVDLLPGPPLYDYVPGVPAAPGEGNHLPHGRRFAANNHLSYPWQSCRGVLTELPGRNLGSVDHPVIDARRRLKVDLAPDILHGNVIFLPFTGNMITSMRLPPPPPGIDLFVTDAMSGCKFYVDVVNGGPDLMVYHANTTQYGPAHNDYADIQRAHAVRVLDVLHAKARADHPGWAFTARGACAKRDYFAAGGRMERHKEMHGRFTTPSADYHRIIPEFVGGTIIVGIPVAGQWEFWYQTCGDIAYERPIGMKRLWSGKVKGASAATFKVVDCQRIC